MAPIRRQVGGELIEIRKRDEVVREVGVVVPDVKLTGDARPGLEIAHEVGTARAFFVGVGFADADGTEADAHVGTGPDVERRVFGVPVGQGVNQLIGILLFDFGSDGVHKAEEGAGVLPAFFLFDAAAAVALTPAFPIILRDRVDSGLGMLPDPGEDVTDGLAEHVGIGEAELRAVGSALAIDEREVLRVSRKVLFGRDHLVEAVDEGVVLEFTAGGFVEVLEVAVGAVASGPIFVESLGEIGLAIFEGWFAHSGERSDGDGAEAGNAADLRGEPAAAELIEEGVNGI